MKKLKEIFQNKTFARLFLANFTQQMGSIIGLTAFMYYVLDRFTNQPVYATVTELMYSLPTIVVFFLVGVFADRLDRQKIAYYCNWISSFLSLLLIGVIMIGWMPLIFTILFIRSAVTKFFFPAEHGMVQGILKKDDYTTAAGLNQLVGSLFMLFGTALGIFAFRSVGIYGAILVDVVCLAFSGLLIRGCRIAEEVRLPNGRHKIKDLKVSFVLKEFKQGFTYVVKHKLLFSLIIGFFILGIVNGGITVMPVFYLKYKLAPETYEQLAAIIGVVTGSGILLGSVIATILVQKFKLYKLMIIGLAIPGIFIVLASLTNSIYTYIPLIFLATLSFPIINISLGGWMPSIVDPKMMGRVQGLINPLMMLSQSFILGFIAYSFPKFITIEAIYWIVGGSLLIVSIFYLMVLPKNVKEFEGTSQTSIKESKAL
ncbi:MFS transporter [Bacillus aquiflavi]|uniref:MFS transporter n=1 Tax=Bacillus aquiflavi TaxID=2672567 RepID=UPI001CAA1978|nr:MFS transporter [Bacillus aquiflavi]UAC48943.1 MFS transporter [Bacillus aquiflavi]